MTPDPLLRIAGVSRRFPGGIVALDGIDLDVAPGEFLSLLGPSGCGKTTMLRLIGGFDSPSAGQVLLEGRDITGLRPFDRPVNTVFQDYALFPHMDVLDNVAFGLSLRKMPRAGQLKRANGALALVGLSDKAGARVGELSGGQRQRVALARALVCEPRLLLLDEPLSALDAHLREQMQLELKRLQTTLGTTFVMVTHDQTEAMAISDRIVVMNRGRIEQVAAPAELYDRPKTRFVAGFIGTMNLLPIEQTLGLGVALRPEDRARATAGRLLGIRPEDLVPAGAGEPGAVALAVRSVVFSGRAVRLLGEAAGSTLVVDVPRTLQTAPVAPGTTLHVRFRPGAFAAVLDA